MNKSIIIKNARLYNTTATSQTFDILIEDTKILQVGKFSADMTNGKVFDANGKIAAPGLIDIHIQGAGGADILDGTEEALKTISKTLAQTGTTSYLGTSVVNTQENNHHLKLACEFVNKDLDGAALLGFHLEGPFINLEKKGGLNPKGIYPSSNEALKEIYDVVKDALKIMTIAPEMPGNLEIIKRLKSKGTIPAFAHSNATYEETIKGFEAGINHVTHIFNAMPGFHHRNPTALNAIFENSEITAQIISDGHHLHPSTIKMIYKILGPNRCICITDGMHGIGFPEGKYIYNGREYESKGGAARYLDGTLIGSTMSLLEIVFKFKEFTGCSLENAINSASKNPANLLGLNKGEIEKGKDADIIILNNDNSLFAAIVNGKVTYIENK
jgi:N-acetylglucosamine-6-phosphate deacetylase